MGHYQVFLPNYSIGSGCYKDIPSITKHYGKKAVVIGGKTAMEKSKDALTEAIAGTDMEYTGFIWYGGESSYENGDLLKENPAVQEAEMLFAVGGGRACDTVKYTADQLGKPLFTFPTLGSNCACCTAISVIYNEDHTFRDYYYPSPAIHTFIDMDIVAESPENYLWAGIGDALSKEIEAVYSSSEAELFHTPSLGLQVSNICTEPLLKYGKKAIEDCRKNVASFELEQVVLDILISTGIVSNLMTGKDYYYNSSLAHCVYYGSTMIPKCEENHLHGEIVSFGVLCLLAYDNQLDQFDRIAQFNKSIGLPVCLADLDLSPEDVPIMTEKASQSTEWKNAPSGLTKEKFIDAVLKADQKGKAIK